jgi:hypothetical protein
VIAQRGCASRGIFRAVRAHSDSGMGSHGFANAASW